MGKGFIHYEATLDGYEVTLFQGGKVLDHYAAGNHPMTAPSRVPLFCHPFPSKPCVSGPGRLRSRWPMNSGYLAPMWRKAQVNAEHGRPSCV
jgi:hypothetical protein